MPGQRKVSREVNHDPYWIMVLLEDEGWSLWDSTHDVGDAVDMFHETEIEPGEQAALIRVLDIRREA